MQDLIPWELNGKYYQTYKEIGDQVKAGDVLLEFDLEEITRRDMTSQRRS